MLLKDEMCVRVIYLVLSDGINRENLGLRSCTSLALLQGTHIHSQNIEF